MEWYLPYLGALLLGGGEVCVADCPFCMLAILVTGVLAGVFTVELLPLPDFLPLVCTEDIFRLVRYHKNARQTTYNTSWLRFVNGFPDSNTF